MVKCGEKGGSGMKKVPQDPIICLSFINAQLRDFYRDLDELCDDLEIDRQSLNDKLNAAGYFYKAGQNQFR